MSESPRLLVVGGPNGSGKTTLSLEYASETGFPYLSADAIAFSLDPSNPQRAQIAAGRAFIQAVDQQIASRRSLVVESTLSGLTLRRTIDSARTQGFSVGIVFLFVDSADVCVERVAERFRKGGHFVPEEDIRRRYPRAAINFWTTYRKLADTWVLVYNRDTGLENIAVGSNSQISVTNPTAYYAFLKIAQGSIHV